jgi:hypothetical protein
MGRGAINHNELCCIRLNNQSLGVRSNTAIYKALTQIRVDMESDAQIRDSHPLTLRPVSPYYLWC